MTNQAYARAEYAEYLHDRETSARSRCCCPECGSADGMLALYAEHVAAYVEEPERYPWPERGMWRWPGCDECLFTPCGECGGEVPQGYEPVTRQWVVAWMDAEKER